MGFRVKPHFRTPVRRAHNTATTSSRAYLRPLLYGNFINWNHPGGAGSPSAKGFTYCLFSRDCVAIHPMRPWLCSVIYPTVLHPANKAPNIPWFPWHRRTAVNCVLSAMLNSFDLSQVRAQPMVDNLFIHSRPGSALSSHLSGLQQLVTQQKVRRDTRTRCNAVSQDTEGIIDAL